MAVAPSSERRSCSSPAVSSANRPGPARSVLASLLTGTSLDFVIQASDTDQTQIQSVLLTPRIKGGSSNDSAASGSQSFSSRIRQQYMNRPPFGAPDSSGADSSRASDSSAAPEPDTASAAASTPVTASTDAQPSAVDQQPSNPTTPALTARLPLAVTEAEAHPAPISSTEQAIPQMQNLFELRRQLQEQQNTQQKATGTTTR